MAVAAALVFAANIEYRWETAVARTVVLGGSRAAGRGTLQEEGEGPAG